MPGVCVVWGQVKRGHGVKNGAAVTEKILPLVF